MDVITRTNNEWLQIPADSKKTTVKHRPIIFRRPLQTKISFSQGYSGIIHRRIATQLA
jgi:hypothetical protein